MTIRIRPADDADVEEIIDLLRLGLGEGPAGRTSEFWRWKHEQNPFGPSLCLVAEAGGQLLGLRAFMRWRWWDGHRQVDSVRAVDTATHPQWRGKGIFRDLTCRLVNELRHSNIAFVFNTPNNQSMPGYLKMGWKAIGGAPVHIRLLKPVSLGRILASSLLVRTPLLARGGEPDIRYAPASECLSMAGELDLVRDLTAEPQRICTDRSMSYLQWRYGLVPNLTYQGAWKTDNGSSALLIFRKVLRGDLRELRLLEVGLGKGPRSSLLAAELLNDLLRASDAHCATGAASPGTAEKEILASCGFFPLRLGSPTITIRDVPGRPSDQVPRHVTELRLSAGDLELF